jgi:hypothetical protein
MEKGNPDFIRGVFRERTMEVMGYCRALSLSNSRLIGHQCVCLSRGSSNVPTRANHSRRRSTRSINFAKFR